MTYALPRLDRATAEDRGLTLADFLVPIRVGERTPTRVRHIVLIAVGALIVSLSAYVVIPTTPVPTTPPTCASRSIWVAEIDCCSSTSGRSAA